MATIKHLTSKNSNYAAAESYLTFQHNEYTGLPILDEKGRPKLRDSYLLDTLECGESSFAMACLIANRKYGKNGGREDVKTHHYIISFDPKDAVENDLTMERAQALGLQFCKDNFPGHPAIVCTHPDGHNSAGNIHVHIVIGSLRVRTVERQPFMDKPCDWEAGKKHRCTSAMLRHLRVAVMEMCEQADLNQINLLEAQGDHVSEREYWAQRRGQRRLDHANAKLAAEGQQPTQTVYQTELDIPIVLTAGKPAEKLKEITDRLEQGITELFDSERYKEYLKVMSKFHNYSFRNTVLIAMQKPDASLLAGFSAWKNNFERNVMRGQKGIKIIAPSPYKIKQEMQKIDPHTQKPIIGKDGKPVTEEKEITIPAYKVVSVFDVSQTEGKELPDIAVDELTGDVDRYKDFFAALEKTSPVPIAFENIEGGSHGYYHLEDKRIAINEGMSELQTLKTAIHEIAHAKLHDISYSLLCKWFRAAVLPADRLLYAELYQTGDKKKCTECGAFFASTSNSVKYCPVCRKRITRRQAAERMRKRRTPVTQ